MRTRAVPHRIATWWPDRTLRTLQSMSAKTVYRALDYASVAVAVWTAYTAIPTWTALPADASVPMQFGIGGHVCYRRQGVSQISHCTIYFPSTHREVGWAVQNKHAYLLFPAIALGAAAFSTFFAENSKMNHAVAVTEQNRTTLRLLGLFLVRVTMLLTNMMMLAITRQCPQADGTLGPIDAGTVQSYLSALLATMAFHFFTVMVVVPVACKERSD